MGEIVNLRRVRKARTKAQDEAVAAGNRVTFGLSRAQKQAAATEQARAARQLDGHRREPDGSGEA